MPDPVTVDLPRVLELVNDARSATGKPPLEDLPVGTPCDATCCTLSRALKAQVGCQWAAYRDAATARRVAYVWCQLTHGYRVQLPDELAAFVRLYDAGCYPELANTEVH